MKRNKHHFWDVVEGRRPYPPCDQVLSCQVLEAEPGTGEVKNQFRGRPDFLNPMGNIMGGFLAAMLDATLGQSMASTLAPDEWAPTFELKINFLRPAAPGPIFGHGRLVHRGQSIAFLEGELRNSDNELLATATATARIVNTK